jgi:disulfide bond formation protein DsbB
MQSLYQFFQSKNAWALLALSAFSLLVAALIFQHVYDHQPCVKCIYQRTAVIGIFLASILVLAFNHWLSRVIALAVWAYSALQGLLVAREHLEVIFDSNSLFYACDIFPNFPSFMPLHEWFPPIFDALGECNDNSWQFLGMGMASWMQIIFSIYLAILAVVIIVKFLIEQEHLKKR